MADNLCVLLIFLSVLSVKANEQPQIVLKDGSVILGLTVDYKIDYVGIETKVDRYLGIPYAKPPVGSLRFRPPEPKEPLEQPLNATKYGNACMQMELPPELEVMKFAEETRSEDCLYLDVFVPNPVPDDAAVLVNIHGGGFTMGSGAFKFLSLMPNVAIGNYIVVSMNYRLNAFGFLSTGDDLLPGNLGLRDQQLSLKWVSDNIAAFGGNPNNVAIIGVSAGGASVGFHLLSPGSSGLFQRAIMESGSPLDDWGKPLTPEQSLVTAQTIARFAGCTKEETAEKDSLLACLQRVPAEDILSNETKVMEELQLERFLLYPPSVDGTFISKPPVDLLKEGAVNPADIIVGTNRDEGALVLLAAFPDPLVTPQVNFTVFQQHLEQFGNVKDPTVAHVVRTLFNEDESDFTKSDPSLFRPFTNYITDNFMLCTQNQFAHAAAAAGNGAVYRYYYTHHASQNLLNISWAGASHGDEMIFVFGILFEGHYALEVPEFEKEMAIQTMTYWTNFIKTGNPNSESGKDKSPNWPTFTAEKEEYLELAPIMSTKQHLQTKECYFITEVLPELRKMAEELNELKEKKEPADDEKAKWSEEGQCSGPDCHTP